MNKVDLEKWQRLEDEFLNSNLDEAAFCKSKKLNLDWFRQKLGEAENREEKNKQQKPENLFVELIPQPGQAKLFNSGSLKIKFREVDFEVAAGFPVEVFRQALQVVKEVV